MELYDSVGKLQSITDMHGYRRSLIYDSVSGRLQKVVGDRGESLTFEFDGANHVSSIVDQAGRKWAYQYDGANNLVAVTYPDGTSGTDTDNPKRTYSYNEPAYTSGAMLTHALTGVTDERGVRVETYEYYSDGRAKASYGPAGAHGASIQYNDAAGTRTVTDSAGNVTAYSTAANLGTALVSNIIGPGCPSCGGE